MSRGLNNAIHVIVLSFDNSWSELVFHVLSHSGSTQSLPSSLYDANYVQFCENQLGPAGSRALGADVEVLSAALTTHERLAQVQGLARLHPTLEAAVRVATKPLTQLPLDGCSDRFVRDALLATVPVESELLRCAALLEVSHFSQLPSVGLGANDARLQEWLPRYSALAPKLRRLSLRFMRVLGRRGRLWPGEVWVGLPEQPGGPTLHDVLWQATHEATVLEVFERALESKLQLSERQVERVAVALLAARAASSTLRDGYRQWFSFMAPEVAEWASLDGLTRELRDWFGGFELTPESLAPQSR